MFVIGERINGMFKDVNRAIREKNKSYIQELTLKQIEHGANALDINVGPASESPLETMIWLINCISEVSEIPICLDSPNPEIIAKSIEFCKSGIIINSTNAEEDKLNKLLDSALKWNARLIALTMDKSGVPLDVNARVELAVKIITSCQERGFDLNNLFIDPVVLPLNVAQEHCPEVLEAIRQIKMLTEPQVKTIIGLSNISQGTKVRPLINRTFLIMAMTCGLDAVILDALDIKLLKSLKTAELLLNKKIYCHAYLKI